MEQNEYKTVVTTSELADIFQVSERQVQRLVEHGVIEPLDSGARSYRCDLDESVRLYCVFLASGVPLSRWAPDT